MAEWLRKKYRNSLLMILCLLLYVISLPALAVSKQVVLVQDKAIYVDGEQLQLQARLVPPQTEVFWTWECTLAGKTEPFIIGTDDKLTLDLTVGYHGAVLRPVVTLSDGTVVRGPEKTLVVELYCIELELAKMPMKATYIPGAAFDPAGMQIFAKMSDGSKQDVTERCSFAPEMLALDTQRVLVTCQMRWENGEMKTFGCSVPVTVKLPEQQGDSSGGISGGGQPQQPDGNQGQGEQKPNAGVGDQTGSGVGSDPKPGDTDKAPSPENPSWSKPIDSGMILGISIVALCIGMGAAIWWLLRKEGREDEPRPPAP